jgi:transposase
VSPITLGLDVGDRRTHFCAIDAARKVVARGSFPTTREQLESSVAQYPAAKVILEAGSQSPWMSRVLRGAGHEVLVADPRRVQLISKDPRKTDRRDAEMLAKMGAAMPELLGDVHHRGEQAQAHLSIVRARDLIVRMRTMAVQQVRGICKGFGLRLPSSSTGGFTARVDELIPELLRPALSSILALVNELTARIRDFDKSLARIAKSHYPEVQHLQQVDGVGPTISVAFVLSMEDPRRFRSSRSVGSWLGLCPRSQASGDSNPQLRISKAGDPRLRRLILQGAHRILGPLGADCDLRRYGLRLAARGGKAPKMRAAVAVARKLVPRTETGLVLFPARPYHTAWAWEGSMHVCVRSRADRS